MWRKIESRDNKHQSNPETIESVLKSSYVDDFLKSRYNTQIQSNSEEVIKARPEPEVSKPKVRFQKERRLFVF